MMREHHRNIPYRPEREGHADATTTGLSVFLDFLRRYMAPRWRTILICILLVSVNSCSFFIMAYYMRIVVDQVLVVSLGAPGLSPEDDVPGRITGRDHMPAPQSRLQQGSTTETAQASLASPRPPGAMPQLMTIFAMYVLTIVALNVAARIAQRHRIDIAQGITGQIREDLHRKILALSRTYHQIHTPGQLMARILSDVNVIQQQLMATVLDASSQVITFLVGTVLLFVIEWRLALIALVSLPPYAMIYRRALKQIRHVNRELRHTNACLYGLVSQKLDAVRAILAYNRKHHEVLNFHRLSSVYLRDGYTQQRLDAGLSWAGFVISCTATTIILLYGVTLVLQGRMTLGNVLYAYGVAATLFVPVQGLSHMSVVVSRLMVIIQRLLQTLEHPLEIIEASDALPFPSPMRSGINLKHVYFSYAAETEPLLKDVSLWVPSGKWVCVMGPSGCGKTTLLHLLARLYDPSSGEIAVDGIPLSRMSFTSLRSHVALVPQEPQIFGGTVRDNISYGAPGSTEARIMEVAKSAESHDFIMNLPVKYETTIGQKGLSLSGGQRQRLSIARAIMTNPQLLLLDDCTSALDADTERRIQDTLARVLQDKTAVIVSQRISMAMRCDKICILINGIISEQGTHQELIEYGGYYADLFTQQTH